MVANRIGRSVRMRTVTRGLTGVTNGSPWFGRSKRRLRLTHGIQRCRSTMPFARVNSQFEPDRVDRSVAEKGTTRVAAAPSGRTPPSGTTIVWSSIEGVTERPSTVTAPRCSPPSRAMTVLSSSRSMPAPDRFWAPMVTRPWSRRVPTSRRTVTSYVALTARLVRWTAPGTISEAAGVEMAAVVATGRGVAGDG